MSRLVAAGNFHESIGRWMRQIKRYIITRIACSLTLWMKLFVSRLPRTIFNLLLLLLFIDSIGSSRKFDTPRGRSKSSGRRTSGTRIIHDAIRERESSHLSPAAFMGLFPINIYPRLFAEFIFLDRMLQAIDSRVRYQSVMVQITVYWQLLYLLIE